MPSRPFTAADLDDIKLFVTIGHELQLNGDSDSEHMASLLHIAAAEPLVRISRQEVGPERLSMCRLKLEAAARGFTGDTISSNIYDRFCFHLEDLEVVVSKGTADARDGSSR